MIKHVIEELAPFREQRARYEKNPSEVEAVLARATPSLMKRLLKPWLKCGKP